MMAIPAIAQDKQPIKIGFGMAETGPLGPNGKSALLAMEIWVEETNAKGGLIGGRFNSFTTTIRVTLQRYPESTASCSMSTKST